MNLIDRLKKINIVGLALILLVPILSNPNFIFPFIYFKNTAFRFLIAILVISVFLYIFEKSRYVGKNNYLLYAFGLFLVVQFLAMIFGINPYNSFWGNYERMDGFLNLFLLGLYLFLVINTFKDLISFVWLFRVSIIGSVFISLYSLLWKINLSLPSLLSSVSGTIGNTAFFGSYLVFNLFLAAILFYVDHKREWRIFYGISLAINLLVLFLNASRGSILGLLFGLLVMMIIYYFKAEPKIKKISLGFLVFLVLFSGLVIWQKDSNIVKNVKFLNRLTSISTSDFSTNNRLLVWQVSYRSFLDRPLFGYGQENSIEGINKYYNSDITEQWFDRSHNFVFDYLTASGILGLISYILLFIVALFYLFKYLKTNYILSTLLIGLLSAYLFINMFVFDTINTYLLFIIVLAFIGFLVTHKNSEFESVLPNIFKKMYYLVIALLVFLVVIFLYIGVINPTRANLLAADAIRYSKMDPAISLKYYIKALKLNTYGNHELSLQLAKYAIEVINAQGIDYQLQKEIFSVAESNLLAILEKDEHNIKTRLILVELYQNYSKFNAFYIDESINILKSNIADSPDRLEIYSYLAQGYFLKGELDTSVEYLEQILQKNSSREKDYLNLINIASQAKNVDKVNFYVAEYFDRFDNISAESYHKIGQYYFSVGEIEKAEQVLITRAIPEHPGDFSNYIALASIYESKDEIEKAIKYLEGVIIEYPFMADKINEYIDYLKNKK